MHGSRLPWLLHPRLEGASLQSLPPSHAANPFLMHLHISFFVFPLIDLIER